jgi:hypothetical protein
MLKTPAERRYTFGMLFWSLVYVGVLFASVTTIRHAHPQGPLLYIIPALPIMATFWLVIRYFAKVDEYLRAVMTGRFIMSTAVTLSLAIGWSFLEDNAGAPHISAYYTYVVFWFSYGLLSAFRCTFG